MWDACHKLKWSNPHYWSHLVRSKYANIYRNLDKSQRLGNNQVQPGSQPSHFVHPEQPATEHNIQNKQNLVNNFEANII